MMALLRSAPDFFSFAKQHEIKWLHWMVTSPGGRMWGNSVSKLIICPFRSCRGSLATTLYLSMLRDDKLCVGFVKSSAGTLATPHSSCSSIS